MKAFSIIFLFTGSLLTILGWLFKIMHWPGSLIGMVLGPVIVIIAVFVLIRTLRRENREDKV